ncbi:MAG: bifunctional (p)ppGpp synthetase/guanosine-3',5'-bis(diphosphate) 3'-pyrophosphohydrolase [Thermoanaerobaculaceae bacterium]|nr:bifunctional (p)ppGpp synthetase/guanosine-3',5'-bis(diphosphate) 3'-pyrophosphohydrolase [Thermoanaerobaculaceae bacterium]MDI9620531.1 HD domain-containing protein [Acidobacteriota bacterium]NLH11948.1 bifunctional (p)ppGpp synthetase/guanosine-3',5'-bis(diphosphate) 3'-pyrophosphohydrolase [Holophagae bacterium]HPW55230.1 HD domain-containing protein [Thermoanaerobaculaceae bacterium]
MGDDDHTDPVVEGNGHTGALDELLKTVSEHNESPDLDLIRRAFELASEVHRCQRRKEGNEPYIVHPLAVARLTADHQMDDVSVAAALLHDCIEDARGAMRVTGPMLASGFGSEVAVIVEGLTKLQRQEVAPSTNHKLATLVKLLHATATADLRTIIIKIFDRAHNLSSLTVFPEHKQRRIALETEKFYIPVATRLGLFKLAREMEDRVMQVLQPEAYHSILQWLGREGNRIKRELKEKAKEICEQLRAMHVDCEYRIDPKGVYSIYQAVGPGTPSPGRLNEGCNFELCLIVGDVDSCFRALNVVHRRLAHLRGSVKDFINSPKINGYQSLHTICTGPTLPRVQVLVRTHEMNVNSDIGVISQLRQGRLQDRRWLDELLDSLEGDGDQVLELTSQVAYAEIQVITPRGEGREVPQGATALDYAYSIHTAIGDRAAAALIDGETRPLGTVLRSGQRVEILTGDDVRPTYERLEWVRTSRAAVAVRRAIRRAERAAFLAEAADFFAYCERHLGWTPAPHSEQRQRLCEALQVSNEEELGREIYSGRLAYDFIFAHLVPLLPRTALTALVGELAHEGAVDTSCLEVATSEESSLRTLLFTTLVERLERRAAPEAPVTIVGLRHSLPIRLAECCRPEYGDDIVALTVPERGATIHRRRCRKVRSMVDQNAPRLGRASWKHRPQRALTRLHIQGRDRRGLFQAIAESLLRMKVDAQSVQLSALPDGSAEGEIWLELPALVPAAEVIERLTTIPGVTNVAPVSKGKD